jgi:hypothetical protein
MDNEEGSVYIKEKECRLSLAYHAQSHPVSLLLSTTVVSVLQTLEVGNTNQSRAMQKRALPYL